MLGCNTYGYNFVNYYKILIFYLPNKVYIFNYISSTKYLIINNNLNRLICLFLEHLNTFLARRMVFNKLIPSPRT